MAREFPRRALVAAMVGALYGLLLLPAPETVVGVKPVGVAWFALSLALLFLHPIAYHVFSAWAIVWVVWRGVSAFQAYPGHASIVLDVGMPALAFLLLMTSGYLHAARAYRSSS